MTWIYFMEYLGLQEEEQGTDQQKKEHEVDPQPE
jgi:hypothetical protein